MGSWLTLVSLKVIAQLNNIVLKSNELWERWHRCSWSKEIIASSKEVSWWLTLAPKHIRLSSGSSSKNVRKSTHKIVASLRLLLRDWSCRATSEQVHHVVDVWGSLSVSGWPCHHQVQIKKTTASSRCRVWRLTCVIKSDQKLIIPFILI